MNKTLLEKIHPIINMEHQKFLVNSSRSRRLWLVIGIVVIVAWQSSFMVQRSSLEGESHYRQNASSGVLDDARFVYFYHYLGLYPLASTLDWKELTYSRKGAEEALQDPSKLRTEIKNTTRYGDYGKVWLFFPDVWLFGFSQPPNTLVANIFAFILVLVLVYGASCYVNRPILGILLVALIGSNPFQLYETYYRPDVFCWPLITLLLVIAIHLPIIASKSPPKWQVYAVPMLTGILIATIREIRSEPATIFAGVALSYLLLNQISLRARAGMLIMLVCVFLASAQLWNSYYISKIAETENFLQEIGGTPYNGPRDSHHMIWHPVWCGLGDFDTKYGYEWRDQVAAKFYEKKRPNTQLKVSGNKLIYNAFWDNKEYYFKTPYELPDYHMVLRDDILQNIKQDPLWFINIILKRLNRLAKETSPLRLAVGQYHIQLNFPMYLLFIPVCIFALISPYRIPLILLIFSLSTSITAFIIFSGKNMTMYSSYHIISASLAINWIVEFFLMNQNARNYKG